MKTLRLFGVTIVMVLLAVNFAACSSDDDEDNSSLIGTWIGGEIIPPSAIEHLIFKSDGKGTWDEDSFKYTINSNKVVIDYGDNDPETWTFSISNNTLNMTAEDGVEYSFKRK